MKGTAAPDLTTSKYSVFIIIKLINNYFKFQCGPCSTLKTLLSTLKITTCMTDVDRGPPPGVCSNLSVYI